MPLRHRTRPADDIRAPAVPRGEAVIVTRYRAEAAKVALVNPDDLAMLEESHDLIEAAGLLDAEPLTPTALKALRSEDRPDRRSRVERADQIISILDL
jgi:hypothetical protein